MILKKLKLKQQKQTRTSKPKYNTK